MSDHTGKLIAMKDQLLRQARRVPAALAVVLCAALLLIPAASRASGHEAGEAQAAPIAFHTTDTALLPHATRLVSVHAQLDLAGVPADDSSYPAVDITTRNTTEASSKASVGNTETFHERAPPV